MTDIVGNLKLSSEAERKTDKELSRCYMVLRGEKTTLRFLQVVLYGVAVVVEKMSLKPDY